MSINDNLVQLGCIAQNYLLDNFSHGEYKVKFSQIEPNIYVVLIYIPIINKKGKTKDFSMHTTLLIKDHQIILELDCPYVKSTLNFNHETIIELNRVIQNNHKLIK